MITMRQSDVDAVFNGSVRNYGCDDCRQDTGRGGTNDTSAPFVVMLDDTVFGIDVLRI